MANSLVVPGTRSARRVSPIRLATLGVAAILVLLLARPVGAIAQEAPPTGSIGGRVVDEQGAPIAGAQMFLIRPAIATATRTDGGYLLSRVPVGAQILHARMLGFRLDSASVTVTAGQQATQDFTLRRDPLQLQTLVVTGTQSPRLNLDASVAVTTLSATEIEQAAPRSTTEMLRYVPGFTRVESSGGEVNQNISIRGILGVEYVAFLEDGLPVFPTMETFFMNADNLFRFDANIERMEVVRGGSSPLFGSNTPGAIVNFINKSGGDVFTGTMRATGATQGLARYDLNMNGPFGDDWRFNVGGFYRYDHGVRNPGFPGIRGGQLKGSVTRLLGDGYVRFSVKHIDDRNQFILPLPFANPSDPDYVSGFGNYGSFSTLEAVDLRIPTPAGDLTLPLDNGLKTKATWFTADVAFDLAKDWHLQNTAQVMQNDQEWNALIPFNVVAAPDYVTGPPSQGLLGFPEGTTFQYFLTNHFDATGVRLPFDTPNGLVAPGGEWHVDKPISAVQNQLSLRKRIGRHALSFGGYLANYTQDNRWFFTDILTDVRDNPRFLDLVVTPPGETPVNITRNGFRHFLPFYVNGTGQTTIASGVVGGEVRLTDRLRADLGLRIEHNTYVQNSENTSLFDLDGDPATPFDIETFGNHTFRHFSLSLTDWSASVGLNFRVHDNLSLYGLGSRGHKMPALDELVAASAQDQVDLFEGREVRAGELGVKYGAGRVAVALNGFLTQLRNITGQGVIVDSVTGATTWEITFAPETRSYGTEIEAFISPMEGLQLLGTGTILEAELGPGIDSLVGERVALAPTTIGNLVALYSPPQLAGLQFKADWHWVGSRFTDRPQDRFLDARLPSYDYFNFGVGLALPDAGARIMVDLLNAFQSKGLEEGNPRLASAGSNIFLARPLLPRRLQASIEYHFGGGSRR
jgi:iron complex outermembrane receptor protein